MAQLVTLITASLGSSISGSLTVSYRMSSLRCQTRAFIGHSSTANFTLDAVSGSAAQVCTARGAQPRSINDARNLSWYATHHRFRMAVMETNGPERGSKNRRNLSE